jgi:hypothetical protein
MNQFEIWKAKPEGFSQAHYFVIISSDERCQSDRLLYVNGLGCFTLRGQAKRVDVVLNGADGFERPTACDCGYFYPLLKSCLIERIGTVAFERQRQIKTLIREIFRLL